MALYWPDQKVALEIIDDPLAEPVDREAYPDWQVLSVTMAQCADHESMLEIGDTLADMLGQPRHPNSKRWMRKNMKLHKELFSTFPY